MRCRNPACVRTTDHCNRRTITPGCDSAAARDGGGHPGKQALGKGRGGRTEQSGRNEGTKARICVAVCTTADGFGHPVERCSDLHRRMGKLVTCAAVMVVMVGVVLASPQLTRPTRFVNARTRSHVGRCGRFPAETRADQREQHGNSKEGRDECAQAVHAPIYNMSSFTTSRAGRLQKKTAGTRPAVFLATADLSGLRRTS